MRSTLAALLTGWLLSCWVQVPPPVQSGVKTVVRWIKARVADNLSEGTRPENFKTARAAAGQASANPE